MTSDPNSVTKVCAPAVVVIVPLIAAAWLTPPSMPLILRQCILCGWGVGATLAFERWLFSPTWVGATRAIGVARAPTSALVVAFVASLPMWLFLPALAWSKEASLDLRDDWPSVLLGVLLVNGIAEEVIHRGFVFGRLRRGRSFTHAAAVSAGIFAAQHLYLIASIGWTAGLASVVLAALLAFPLAYSFDRNGRSIAAPAVLHTSANAPMLILTTPGDFLSASLLPHMGIVLVSLYCLFVCWRPLRRQADSEG